MPELELVRNESSLSKVDVSVQGGDDEDIKVV
jgi:hypothetical protein